MSFHPEPIHVFIVARPLLRWGFEKLVQTAYLGIRIVGTADTLDGALDSIAEVRADLMVVDHDEVTPATSLERVSRHVPVLLLKADGDGHEFPGAHVAAVVRKSESPGALLRAIEEACERARGRSRRSPMAAMDAGLDEDQIRISRLTARERELILALLCSDTEPGKIIAGRLCISEQTLRNHLSSIYGKLGVHSRLGLHAYAVRHGLDRMTQ